MLVPRFTVRMLPVDLTNLVKLQYRHDGVLVAPGYNGNVWLLRDMNGDGMEDQVSRFWEAGERLPRRSGWIWHPKAHRMEMPSFLPAKER